MENISGANQPQHPRSVGDSNFTINRPPLITLLQIISPTPLCTPWMLIQWSRLKFARIVDLHPICSLYGNGMVTNRLFVMEDV